MASENRELLTLIGNRHKDLPDWIRGKIPKHYKRLSVDNKEAFELAKLGASKIGAYFNVKLYYSQSIIAGAILSGKYNEFVIVTPSQYGKALADDTPVLTSNGWKKHGELAVGDEVVAPNGNFVKVLQVHPKCEMDRVVVLENGDEFVCHHNHEWVCRHRNPRTNEYTTKNIPVWEMEERGLYMKGGQKRFVFPIGSAPTTGKESSEVVGVVEIRKTGGIQGNCITVEGGEYCVGDNLIVTHNSYLMGMLALLNAYVGRPTYIAAADTAKASIIMENVISAVQRATPEIQNALLNTKDQLEKLAVSLSKQRVAFANGGFVEAITLADTFENNVARNQAVGRGGDFFVDEAALVTNDTFTEMGRREFARTDGGKYNMVMISNPHNAGYFYDRLTDDDVPKERFILWIDALTAIEEERWSAETVLESDFAQNKHARTVYLLCELDAMGDSMFGEPQIYTPPYKADYTQYFLGVDAAYKGKDNICVALNAVGEDGKAHIEEVLTIQKNDWDDDITPQAIITDITRIARKYRVALVCVDVGWGVWLIQGLKNNDVPVKGINFGEETTRNRKKANHYAAVFGERKRDEMHLDLQGAIEDGWIYFSEQVWDEVKNYWTFIKADRKPNGKIKVVPKSEIKSRVKKSPDELDAILLAQHAAIIFGGEWTSFE